MLAEIVQRSQDKGTGKGKGRGRKRLRPCSASFCSRQASRAGRGMKLYKLVVVEAMMALTTFPFDILSNDPLGCCVVFVGWIKGS